MKHIVVDLEMNYVAKKSDARRICRMETIEIGAVMLDDNLQEISAFRTYVNYPDPKGSGLVTHP